MQKAIAAIERVAERTDRAVLFHSASGKDSIALLDLMAPRFREVTCVYMYILKNLGHINRYINYALSHYPNVKFIQIPHFALLTYIKNGFLGCEVNPAQTTPNLTKMAERVRQATGIEWQFFGFKEMDSMQRRLMLRNYDGETTNFAMRKCYPLSTYTNKQVLEYIDRAGLIRPEKYGNGASCGVTLNDPLYLAWLEEHWPDDLEKVYDKFPDARRLLFEYHYAHKD